MQLSTGLQSAILVFLISTFAAFGQVLDAFSAVPSEQRDALSKRLDGYVDADRHHDWEKLYRFISATGKGGADAHAFVIAMKNNHSEDFEQYPTLKIIKPQRTVKNGDGYDIYGCADATREGEPYSGVAVVHAVFEQQDWFFTGWTFSDGECSDLSEPKWLPDSLRKWNKPMEEVANAH
jgi:hypothetical protein